MISATLQRHHDRLNEIVLAVNDLIDVGIKLEKRISELEGKEFHETPMGEVPLATRRQADPGTDSETSSLVAPAPSRVLGDHPRRRARDHGPVGLREPIGSPLHGGPEAVGDPTPAELDDPLFDVIWNVIRRWDLQRDYDALRSGATGTDVVAILRPLKAKLREMQPAILEGPDY